MLASSAFLFMPQVSSTVTSASVSSTTVNPAANYGDIMQYDFPANGGNSSGTRYSAGPAPNSADIMWRTNVSVATQLPQLIAFDGKIYSPCTIDGNIGVRALDPFTGDILWTTFNGLRALTSMSVSPGIIVVAPNYVLITGSPGTWCLNADSGQVVWKNPDMFVNTDRVSIYSPEEKMLYALTGSIVNNFTITAWNLTDPTKSPTIAWKTPVEGTQNSDYDLCYGDGLVFHSPPNGYQMAFNATTGALVWETPTTGTGGYAGVCYMGLWIHAGLDNTVYALNDKTGKLVWSYNPGTFWGYFASGPAAAYGIVYELNTDGHLYALNATTGALIWKYGGAYEGNPYGVLHVYPGFPVVADGKIYQNIGTNNGRNQNTGQPSHDETVCLDAYTGKLIWTLPVAVFATHDAPIVAYGNLYAPIGHANEAIPNSFTDYGEVWCIGTSTPTHSGPADWSMFRGNPAQTAGGGTNPVGSGGPTNMELKWKFQTGGAVISSPTIVNGVVYVGSQDKNIYAIDANTGNKIWNFTTGYMIRSSPACVDGKVYTGADDGNVYCIDANTGKQVCKTLTGGISLHSVGGVVPQLRSSPIVFNGNVYVGALDGNLYCLNPTRAVI